MNVFTYSLKVWLTSVIVAPCLFLIVGFFKDHKADYESFGTVPFFMLAELVYSFVTWICFVVIVFLVLTIPGTLLIKKTIIFLLGIVLTVGSFFILLNMVRPDAEIIILMLCNCSVIGFGVWFYKLKSLHGEEF